MSNPAIYTVPSLAERWGTSDTFIYTLLNTGKLAGFKLGNKLWRVKAEAVEAFEAGEGC